MGKQETELPADWEQKFVELIEALKVYADPGFYHACLIICDHPTGGFGDDFEFDEQYGRDMPGKHARAVLADLETFLIRKLKDDV